MSILAWHFTKNPDKLRDGTPFKVGEWVEVTGDLVLCARGLHASIDPYDALNYAPGPYLWRVECDGEILEGKDKLCCSKRRAIAGGDATEMLYAFARACASDVVHLWEAPEVVKHYLATGEGRYAARCAARDAVRYAARAAWEAARSAARSAAWDAVRAARSAARDAACAARDAARDIQRKRFSDMCAGRLR